MSSSIIGMNKYGHHSSVAVVTNAHDHHSGTEILIRERFSRIKYDSGNVDQLIFKKVLPSIAWDQAALAESGMIRPRINEEALEKHFPYFDSLKRMGLERISSFFNPDIEFVPHHRSHAYSAVALAPFEKSIVVVIDATGGHLASFADSDPEKATCDLRMSARNWPNEACSAYLQNGPALKPVYKEWQAPGAIGLGWFYSEGARYVFNSHMEGGKVMGLAPYGAPKRITDRNNFLDSLAPSKSFKASGRSAWQDSGLFSYYADISASVQSYFEEKLLELLGKLKRLYPDYPNVILVGGCALNCVANWKVVRSGLFEQVYVPPFPSDEGIAFGAANALRLSRYPSQWRSVPWEKQVSNWGHAGSIPTAAEIETKFGQHKPVRHPDVCVAAAAELARGRVLGWFQGRSESGPRALGHRSILADPGVPGMKDRLNSTIKNRESFRPFAPACLWENATEYFEVDPGFDSPFMSFSPPVRPDYRHRLREAMHIDGSSRIQTVRSSQNPKFYRLIQELGKKTGIYCVLNTSLNVMGEPIVETIDDAVRFYEQTSVDGLVIEDHLILK